MFDGLMNQMDDLNGFWNLWMYQYNEWQWTCMNSLWQLCICKLQCHPFRQMNVNPQHAKSTACEDAQGDAPTWRGSHSFGDSAKIPKKPERIGEGESWNGKQRVLHRTIQIRHFLDHRWSSDTWWSGLWCLRVSLCLIMYSILCGARCHLNCIFCARYDW